MADRILVQGARDVAPKFTDFGKDFADRFKETYGNAVVLRQQQLELEKKENEIRSKDFLSVDNIDLTTVGEDVLDSTSKEAFKIKDEAFDLIKRKDEIGVTEYNIQLAKLQNKVKGLNSLMKMKKSLGSDYTNVAKNIEMAPWGNPQNKAALIAAIDLNTKKEWVEKNGKYFLSTDGGKTLIDLASISPVEAADKSILLKLEDAAFGRLKKRSLTSGSLTDERIRDVAAKTVNSISDEDVKNAALGYFLKDKTRSEQEAYYAITPMAKIRKDVEDTLYLRDLSLYAKELNEIRKPKPDKTDPEALKQQKIFSTNNLIKNIKIPRTKEDMVDFNSTVFSKELSSLNISPKIDKEIELAGGDALYIKSAVPGGDDLIISSDMSDDDIRRTLLLAKGVDAATANRIYPKIYEGPSEDPYSQFITN